MIAILTSLLGALSADPACNEGTPRLVADYQGSRIENCTRTETGFSFVISPEAKPINRSPWYAFDILSETDEIVTVDLHYSYGRHRYHPKRLSPNGIWSPLPQDAVSVSEDGTHARVRVDIKEPWTRIAAQPLFDPITREEWVSAFSARSGFSLEVLDQTPNGNPLLYLSSSPGNAGAPLLLVLGGQHPPEVPGTLAMRAFLERLGGNDRLAKDFRRTFRIDIFPMLNPDGIAAGHWRLNSKLVDLNRDWGPFTQVETQVVRDRLEARISAGDRPRMMVDFHATFKGDILYTPTGDEGRRFEPMMQQWSDAIDLHLGEPGFTIDPTSNPGLPTAKTWFTTTHAAPGVTLEIADRTDADRAGRLGHSAAEEMMILLLADHDTNGKTER